MQILVIAVAALAAIAAGLLWINRPVTVPPAAGLPSNVPESGFSHRGFEALLERFVDRSGGVDYDAWHGSAEAMGSLDEYLGAVATCSPESAPERFATANDELAYWIYAYNACVIRGILRHWPVASVTDIKAPLEVVKGLGFFYRNRYVFGGRAYSLLAVENDRIRRRFKDPRIHFVLNCGSESCPSIRPGLPDGDDLERMLADASREFVADPRNVRVDHARRVIRLSAIFRMYRQDFVNHVRASGRPAGDGILEYIVGVAPDEMRREIEHARDYTIEFTDFDWSLNSAQSNAPLRKPAETS